MAERVTLRINRGGYSVPLNFFVVGVGGNGGPVALDIGHEMQFNKNIGLTLLDGGTVGEENLGRQPFTQFDVGKNKAVAMGEKLARWGLAPNIISEYITTPEMMISIIKSVARHNTLPVLLGCLDNKDSRRVMDRVFYSKEIPTLIYIDAGIQGIEYVLDESSFEYELQRRQGHGRSKKNVPPEVIEKLKKECSRIDNNSGWIGQVVCGYKSDGKVLLPPVGYYYPNLITGDDPITPDGSCNAENYRESQRRVTNKLAATVISLYTSNIIRGYEIATYQHHFNSKIGDVIPSYITKEHLDDVDLAMEAINEREEVLAS